MTEPSKPHDTEIETTTDAGAVEPNLGLESDPKTDTAVDDIMKSDGDAVLKAQDDVAQKATIMKPSKVEAFKNKLADWWGNPRKRYGTIGILLAIVVTLGAVPFTRYNILGLALKAPVTVHVVDSRTGTGVSGATVHIANSSAQTDANGKVTLRVPMGSKTLSVTKKYYQGYSHGELIAMSGAKNMIKAPVVALGRQVGIVLVNKVSGKPVVGATISTSGAKAKTDANGKATIIAPSGSDTQSASISLVGYNTIQTTIDAAGNAAKNTFNITPSGKLYFLSNLSGNIDVVKTNLDGTDRQTVLAGTGSEDRSTTSLLASRDWKYLALVSKRSGSTASVYLIDTTNGDKLTTIDQGDATFSFVGWSGSRFIYQVTRTAVQDWQPNQQALKSLDATTGQTLLLDQTQASGTNGTDYVKQSFGTPYIVGSQVVYPKSWQSNYAMPSLISDKQAELDTIGADGSGHKTLKSFAFATGYQASYLGVSAEAYEPNGIYIYYNDGSKDHFYDYDDGSVTDDATMRLDKYQSTVYATYLLSPSGNSTFWSEQRDGKNTLFVGNADAKNQKQVASLSAYNTYGWFSDDYILVSKGSSELYIMPAAGGTPLKITDYYKPAVNYNGYGGGYGGL